MPTMKYCAAFPCPNLVSKGETYCPEHRREKAQVTAPKETDPFYGSAAWKRFRNWYIAQHPLCEQCEEEGRTTAGVIVDHVIEIKDGGPKLDPENARTLCRLCHARKTMDERKKRNRRTKRKPVVYSY